MQRLRKRQDFLHVRDGRKANAATLTLQARPSPGARDEPRSGFTVTKKNGNAVMRNRIRRRLRAAMRLSEGEARAGYDYVLVGRPGALDRPFATILTDLRQAFGRVHADRPSGGRMRRQADEAPR